MDIERLMDMASDPHESNIYLATNYSELTESIARRLSNALCNSKHFTAMLCLIL